MYDILAVMRRYDHIKLQEKLPKPKKMSHHFYNPEDDL